jgi:ABC-2 type transport system ATP-binding protein
VADSTITGAPALPLPSEAAVVARGLAKHFGDEVVISDLTMTLPRNSIVGLVGPSGCGKTTLIRLMTGTLVPTDGEITVNGVDPTRLTRDDRRHIGYLPQQPVLFPELSVWNNLSFHASLYGVRPRRRRRLREMLDFVDLYPDRRKRVRNISGGMQRRVALASALVHDPRLVFLDEPTAGIDPILRQRFWDHFRTLRDEGRTLIVSTQYVGEAAYCDLVAVLAHGHLITMGTPEELRRRAYGGEIVEIVLADPPSSEVVHGLAQQPGALGPVNRPDACTVQVLVEDATEYVPRSMRWLEAQQVDVVTCQEQVPDLDDVFVRLVERDRATAADVDAGAA